MGGAIAQGVKNHRSNTQKSKISGVLKISDFHEAGGMVTAKA